MKDKISVMINGKKKEYDLLFTVDDEKTGNKYVVYTDNELNEKGNSKIYLGKYKDNKLMTITDEEKNQLEKIVSIVQEEVCNES